MFLKLEMIYVESVRIIRMLIHSYSAFPFDWVALYALLVGGQEGLSAILTII